MNNRCLFARIAIPVAALALGAAFASAPALAQSRNVNDGGMPPEPPATAPAAAPSKVVAPQQPAYYGRNDGGLPPEPTAAAKSAVKSTATASKQAAPAPLGRNVNDGGLTTLTAQ
jgi:hypothetical protein